MQQNEELRNQFIENEIELECELHLRNYFYSFLEPKLLSLRASNDYMGLQLLNRLEAIYHNDNLSFRDKINEIEDAVKYEYRSAIIVLWECQRYSLKNLADQAIDKIIRNPETYGYGLDPSQKGIIDLKRQRDIFRTGCEVMKELTANTSLEITKLNEEYISLETDNIKLTKRLQNTQNSQTTSSTNNKLSENTGSKITKLKEKYIRLETVKTHLTRRLQKIQTAQTTSSTNDNLIKQAMDEVVHYRRQRKVLSDIYKINLMLTVISRSSNGKLRYNNNKMHRHLDDDANPTNSVNGIPNCAAQTPGNTDITLHNSFPEPDKPEKNPMPQFTGKFTSLSSANIPSSRPLGIFRSMGVPLQQNPDINTLDSPPAVDGQKSVPYKILENGYTFNPMQHGYGPYKSEDHSSSNEETPDDNPPANNGYTFDPRKYGLWPQKHEDEGYSSSEEETPGNKPPVL